MSLVFDRAAFFAGVRPPLFGSLSPPQVAGCEVILAEAERRGTADLRALAYVLATAYWETGRTMQPVREAGHGRGHAYGLADPGTGHAYYGRGLVQLTWKGNYKRMAAVCGVDLVGNPDLALRPDVAVAILFEGMERGLFTGRSLGEFFRADLTDWVGARRIVNGTDQAEAIAGFAQRFSAALRGAAAPAQAAIAAATPALSATPTRSLFGRLKTFFTLAS